MNENLAPCDAINLIQPPYTYNNKNLTYQGGIVSQNNTLQSHAIGVSETFVNLPEIFT